jgi:tetratricopeptide (TPR) repeat protein
MRNTKQENSSLPPFVNPLQLLGTGSRRAVGAAVVSVVLLLHGCGGSAPVQSDSAPGRVDAAETVPGAASAAYERAILAMASGAVTEAELELEHLVLEYPRYSGPYVNLAILYRESGHLDQAVAVLNNALALNPNHPEANNQLGMAMRARGEFVAAEAAYLRAIAADPEYALAHYNLGILLDLYLLRPADALQQYERYQDLQSEPDNQVAGWIIDLRRRLGITANIPRVAQEVSR